MKVLPPIDPTTINSQPAQEITTSSGLTSGCGTVYFMNKSNIGITVTFDNGSTILLPAWYARALTLQNKSTRLVYTQAYALNQANPPISQLYLEAFQKGEDTTGLYSGPIPYQNTVTGSVNSNVNTTSAINNTSNAPGTSIINAQPSDATTPTWTADNSGNLTVKGDNAGTLTTLLQLIAGASPAVKLAAAAILTEVLGNLKVDGTSSLDNGKIVTDGSGNETFSNNTAIKFNNATGTAESVLSVDASNNTNLTAVAAGGKIQFLDQTGVVIGYIDTTELALRDGIRLLWSTGDTLHQTHAFTGTGSGTYNHGCSAAPYIVIPIVAVSGSATQGYDTVTSTQVHITLGASLSFKALCLVP